MGLLARLSGKTKTKKQPTESRAENTHQSFRGVQIVPKNDECCQAAKSIASERFLLEETPMLPLTTCDVDVCHCAYERFDDRRAETRRASDLVFDIASQMHGLENRSPKSPGRRSKDINKAEKLTNYDF